MANIELIVLFLLFLIIIFIIAFQGRFLDLSSRIRKVERSIVSRGRSSERGSPNMPRYYKPKEIKESGRDWAEAVLRGAQPKPRSEAECQQVIEHAKSYADYENMMRDLGQQTNADALNDAFRSGVLEAIRGFR